MAILTNLLYNLLDYLIVKSTTWCSSGIPVKIWDILRDNLGHIKKTYNAFYWMKPSFNIEWKPSQNGFLIKTPLPEEKLSLVRNQLFIKLNHSPDTFHKVHIYQQGYVKIFAKTQILKAIPICHSCYLLAFSIL